MYYFNKWINIIISNPFKTINSIKGFFKLPKIHFFFCKKEQYPFVYSFPKGKLFNFRMRDVQWKDKFDTPRFEECPLIQIAIFNFVFVWAWSSQNYDYWEQVLWYLHYYSVYKSDKPNIFLARKNWPWKWKNKSTWQDEFLEQSVIDLLNE